MIECESHLPLSANAVNSSYKSFRLRGPAFKMVHVMTRSSLPAPWHPVSTYAYSERLSRTVGRYCFHSYPNLTHEPFDVTSRRPFSMPRLEGSPPPRGRPQPIIERVKSMPGEMQKRYDALSPRRKVSEVSGRVYARPQYSPPTRSGLDLSGSSPLWDGRGGVRLELSLRTVRYLWLTPQMIIWAIAFINVAVIIAVILITPTRIMQWFNDFGLRIRGMGVGGWFLCTLLVGKSSSS